MKLTDIDAMRSLQVALKNAERILRGLEGTSTGVEMYINAVEITDSDDARIMVKEVAKVVYLKRIEEIKAKLIVCGVDDFTPAR